MDGSVRSLVQISMLKVLKSEMHPHEIIAAHDGKQPFLDKMREVTCRHCAVAHCSHHSDFMPAGADVFSVLMAGTKSQMVTRAEALIAQLILEEEIFFFEKNGVSFHVRHTLSMENPKIFISLKKGEKVIRITCEAGKRLLRVNRNCQELTSVEQVRQKIGDVFLRLYAAN